MGEWDQMDLREIGWGGVEWIHLAQHRDRWRAVVNAVMNLRVLAPRSCLEILFAASPEQNRRRRCEETFIRILVGSHQLIAASGHGRRSSWTVWMQRSRIAGSAKTAHLLGLPDLQTLHL
jgi:hypothetical protein